MFLFLTILHPIYQETQPMPKTIISDTSCIYHLPTLANLNFYTNFTLQIVTTEDIATEYGETLPEWVEIVNVTDKYIISYLQTSASVQADE